MTKLDNAYAIVIGVGADLKESVIDATAIYNILVDENLCGYKENNVFLLTEGQATKSNILNTLEEVKNTSNQDSSILLFYSGHGGYHEGEQIYYLQPNDFSSTNYIDAKDLREIINSFESKRLVLFLDCCHAAGMFKEGIGTNQTTLRQSDNEPTDNFTKVEGLAQKIDDDQGISVVSSCRENQLSWIMDGDINSLFTKCLIQVLKAEHKTFFEEDYIRISEVVQYIFRKVPEVQPTQNPYVNLQIYDDFVLSNIPKGFKDNVSHTLSSGKSEKKVEKTRKEVVTSFRETENAVNLLLFVHGFTGEASDTFGKMPEFLVNDSAMDGWDIKPLGYSPNIAPETGNNVWASYHDIKRVSDYLATSVKYKFSKYQRIAIVAHGLGGLAVQKSLVTMGNEELLKISHVILYATPSLGLDEKIIEKLWNGDFKELRTEGEFIQELRNDWNSSIKTGQDFKFKVAAGINDQYIPVESCHAPFADNDCVFVNGDHFSMVKPETTDEDAYQLIIRTLTGNEFFSSLTNQEEINLLLGEYESVVQTLLPKSKELDLSGLRRLAFALEGLDRREEINQILENHELAKNNSDLMGIIGGRYKRDYLTNFETKSGEQSFVFYEKGLQIADNQDDKSQIFYLSINLAFLSLILKNDEKLMEHYAKKALDAAEECRDNLWKIATIAEANLYLDNLEIAEKKYKEAAEKADIRQKLSMYTNAYAAYTTLMGTTSESDKFIRFLKNTLLK